MVWHVDGRRKSTLRSMTRRVKATAVLAALLAVTAVSGLRLGLWQPEAVEFPHLTLEAAHKIRADWTSFVNTTHVSGLAADGDRVWTVGGGVRRYDLRTNSYTTFYTEHGLASNDTRAISVEDDFVWVVTAAGVSRFSRKEKKWQNFSVADGLADDLVVSVALDRENRIIWFGTWDSGLSRYDIENDRWQSYSTKDGLSNDCVISLAVDSQDNILWCGTWGGGVSQLNLATGKWRSWDKTSNLASNTVTAIAVQTDVVWFGTLDSGLCRFDKSEESWETFSAENGLGGNAVSAIVVDSAGTSVWVGTRDGGLSRLRTDVGKWEVFGGKDGLLMAISAVSLADNTQLLLGTWGKGLVKFDYRNNEAQVYGTTNEIAHNQVVGMFADSVRNALWVGTEGGGASSYELAVGQWNTFNREAKTLPNNTVNRIVVTGGQDDSRDDLVWFGTLDGVVRINQQTTLTVSRELSEGLVESFAQDPAGKVLWVGTNNQGLYRYDLQAETWQHVEELPDYIYFSLAWDEAEKTLWCGTEEGIQGYEANSRRPITFDSFPAPDADIRSIVVDDKHETLWAGSWLSGLFGYDKQTRQWTRYTKADGLPGDTVVGLALDTHRDGHEALWVGTNMGAAKYEFSSGEWVQFSTADGLAHNFILAIALDNSGSVWFGTWGGGVSKYENRD